MVRGIEIFRKFFEGHEDQYAIIGGAACDLIFSDAGAAFRAAKDIDMVLCVEVVDAAFGARFRDFLKAGGYQAAETQGGKRQFYRFHKPADAAFPFMIELFSRKPDTLSLPDDVVIAKIPVEDAVISLSAILLDDAYFEALTANRRVIDGVSILDQSLLIPFKARAWLDLADRAAGGERDRLKADQEAPQRCDAPCAAASGRRRDCAERAASPRHAAVPGRGEHGCRARPDDVRRTDVARRSVEFSKGRLQNRLKKSSPAGANRRPAAYPIVFW